MPQITHKLTPAQMDIIANLKRGVDVANAMLENTLSVLIAGVAPVGSKLVDLKDSTLTIDVPAVELAGEQKPE